MAPIRRSNRAYSTIAVATRPYHHKTQANVTRTADSSQHNNSAARQQGSNGLRLTVKAEPSKLRQATSGNSLPSNPYAETSESDATPAPAPSRPTRASRNPRTVVEADTDEDMEEDDEEEEEDDDDDDDDEDELMGDGEGYNDRDDVDDELLANEDSEQDAEGSDDEISDPHPPRPIIKQRRNKKDGKANVTISAAPPREGPLKSVEAKHMGAVVGLDDDDELSELESGDELAQEDVTGLGEDQEDEEDEDDDNDDSDEDNDGSRSATPDLSKLTRRQRGHFEDDSGALLALSNEAQKKKHLTAEEHAMRRAEMARRRKNLSEKRNEEEKMDTINKLLKKPAPKRKTRAEMLAQHLADGGTPGYEGDGDDELQRRADPVYTRWTHSSKGSRLGVAEEWLEAPIGETLRVGWAGPRSNTAGEVGARVLVEEVA
ncbi:hypothetical protein K431DRAFT_215799 [Polychaeton citri CBS 116435]|uniref:INO80 complex subunit B-like conserved region domain-containing protein n=1 Tax=Polychaeton citri CBS 116435 TaxID=1314669 RepID=A0A9P4QE56_9PEZI|nr:hypothetical protein K431DRAFT_215799 [Polychaeton citri CBS 116435]